MIPPSPIFPIYRMPTNCNACKHDYSACLSFDRFHSQKRHVAQKVSTEHTQRRDCATSVCRSWKLHLSRCDKDSARPVFPFLTVAIVKSSNHLKNKFRWPCLCWTIAGGSYTRVHSCLVHCSCRRSCSLHCSPGIKRKRNALR